MSILARYSQDTKSYIIEINGKFNFSILTEFRKAYKDEGLSSVEIILDLKGTDAIDSSALGMLLNLQRYFDKPDGEIKIINCNEVIEKVFRITSFDKKFTIK